MKKSTPTRMVVFGLCTLAAIWIGINTVSLIKVEGDESVVRQHWKDGVVEEVYRDGTHFFVGWFWDTYKYDIGTQKITFDDQATNTDAEYPAIKLNVGEGGGQSVWIPMSVNYRIGHELTDEGVKFTPSKLVALHKDGLRKTYESVILKRTIIEVVNKIARPKEALEIYSGKGYNLFVAEIQEALTKHEIFRKRGIFIENVIVYNVNLSPKYEAEIEAKQLAIQKALREQEERKAADQRALRAKSEAQAEVETRTQKAEAAKQERIKAAEAEKAEQVLAAEGKAESDVLKAKGVLAIGKAEAEVQELKREALYAGVSGERRAQVEIATAQAEKLRGIFDGVKIVPEGTILNISDGQGMNNNSLKLTVPAEG